MRVVVPQIEKAQECEGTRKKGVISREHSASVYCASSKGVEHEKRKELSTICVEIAWYFWGRRSRGNDRNRIWLERKCE